MSKIKVVVLGGNYTESTCFDPVCVDVFQITFNVALIISISTHS